MIFFTAEATADSQRLYEFLEPKNPGAAARAMQAIWTKLELVERMPGLGLKTRSPHVRQVVARFGKEGYVVRYTVREADGALLVLRIWHAREARR